MTDTVNKQKLLDAMHGTFITYIRLGQQERAFEVKEWMDALRKGTYDGTPSTPVQGYREALEWYADESVYNQNEDAFNPEVIYDGGERARHALSQPDIQPTEQIDYRDRYEEAVQLLKEVSELISWRDNGSGKEEALRLIYQWASRPPGINSTEDDQPGPSERLIQTMRQAFDQADPPHANRKQPGEYRQKQWERFAYGRDPTLPDMKGKWTDEKCTRCGSKIFVSDLGQRRCKCSTEDDQPGPSISTTQSKEDE